MNEAMPQWETKNGVKFLKKIGLKSGQTVLDFGCRVGHYTIPAAKVVGNEGIVYAVDKERQALDELRHKALAYNLTNIKIIKTSGRLRLPLESGIADVILFYDILHYLKRRDRKKLYNEAFRILKQCGFLSVYPKHTLGDGPMQKFGGLSVSDVKQEIEDSDFVFERKHCGLISHDDGLNLGCVLNLSKYAQEEKSMKEIETSRTIIERYQDNVPSTRIRKWSAAERISATIRTLDGWTVIGM
jgi:SAM-dependent methyltransferase